MHTLLRVLGPALLLWIGLSAFILSPSMVPEEKIISGGPGKDGIPALTFPKHESTATADLWLKPQDLVLGLELDGQSRAYPIRILNWHEIVNDRIGNHSYVITYCPLCDSGMAFESADHFGVSGLLYQSDVLLYDRQTESLWSQIRMQAIAGKRTGEKLNPIPIEHTSWHDWKTRHMDTLVLSRHTGFYRDYDHNPYAGYDRTDALYFPVNFHDARLAPKARVIGLGLNGKHKAWAMDALKLRGTHDEVWQGRQLHFEVRGEGVNIIDSATKKQLATVRLYWFAWSAFHPDSELSK